MVFANPFRRPAEFVVECHSPLIEILTPILSLDAAAHGKFYVRVRSADASATCAAVARARLLILSIQPPCFQFSSPLSLYRSLPLLLPAHSHLRSRPPLLVASPPSTLASATSQSPSPTACATDPLTGTQCHARDAWRGGAPWPERCAARRLRRRLSWLRLPRCLRQVGPSEEARREELVVELREAGQPAVHRAILNITWA